MPWRGMGCFRECFRQWAWGVFTLSLFAWLFCAAALSRLEWPRDLRLKAILTLLSAALILSGPTYLLIQLAHEEGLLMAILFEGFAFVVAPVVVITAWARLD